MDERYDVDSTREPGTTALARSVVVDAFGGPEVLRVRPGPAPVPGPGQLSVAVAAASVAWLDTKIRAGQAPPQFPVTVPYVPGSAVAGTVTALGPGTDPGWRGTRVVTHAVGGYGGGYAELAIAAAADVFAIPPGLDTASAAALIDDGTTALALLEETPVSSGDRVLVTPGLGGLGHLAVQLARLHGARVLAAVHGPEKAHRARTLADEVVDYADPSWPRRVRELTGGLDVVFDGVGGEVGAAAAALLVEGGRFSGYGMTSGSPTTVARGDLRMRDMGQLPGFGADAPRRVRLILDHAAAGRVIPIIGATFPLAEAASAHTAIEERRVTGKVLLTN